MEFIKNDINKMPRVAVVGGGTGATKRPTFAELMAIQIDTPQITRTENGAVAVKTTGEAIVDFFGQAGAMRSRSADEKYRAFMKAYIEDPLVAMKMLFYFRDVRGGQGERQLFRDIVSRLVEVYPQVVRKNINLFSEYGRWDDLYVLFGTSVEGDVVSLFKDTLEDDWKSPTPSLLAKWLKSVNTSSAESRKLGAATAKALGLTQREYRKMLSTLRGKIKVFERRISAGEFDTFTLEDLSALPSGAMMKYRNMFYKRLPDLFENYLAELEKPQDDVTKEKKVKVNADTLYPHEIVGKITGGRGYGYSHGAPKSEQLRLLNQQWKALPNYIKPGEKSIVMADTSGSMFGTPYNVSIALAVYMAERNEGPYKDLFMTFAERPQFVRIKGDDLYQKLQSFKNINAGNTDVEAAFNMVLNLAIQNGLSQDEMLDKIYIVSDMEFDQAKGGRYSWRNTQETYSDTLMEKIRRRYQDAGYEMPQLVYWNVDARNTQFPEVGKHGIAYVSGYSPSVFETLMSGKITTPLEMVLKVINKDRYSVITV